MWAQRRRLQSENRYITSKVVDAHGIFFHLIVLKFRNLKKHLIVPFTFSCVFPLDTFWHIIIFLSVHCHVWGYRSLFDVLTGSLFLQRKHCKHHVCWINIKQTERKNVCDVVYSQTTDEWNGVRMENSCYILDLNPDSDQNFVHLYKLLSWERLSGGDREHVLCMIHIPYISDVTWSQEISAPRATEMLTVHTCGVKMNHMCAIGRNLPVFSEQDIQQFCHEHFYGLCLLDERFYYPKLCFSK